MAKNEQGLFDIALRKRLSEHYDWEKAADYLPVRTGDVLSEKRHSNPSLKWKRTARKAKLVLEDSILLADSTDDDKHDQVFTEDLVVRFNRAVLGFSRLQNVWGKLTDEELKIKKHYADELKSSTLSKIQREVIEVQRDKALEAIMERRKKLESRPDIRRATIAYEVARECLTFLLQQYEMYEQDFQLQKPIRDAFQEAELYCNSILNKINSSSRSVKV